MRNSESCEMCRIPFFICCPQAVGILATLGRMSGIGASVSECVADCSRFGPQPPQSVDCLALASKDSGMTAAPSPVKVSSGGHPCAVERRRNCRGT